MTQPLRIALLNAWYHFMNRRRRGEVIFSDVYDYGMFVDLLKAGIVDNLDAYP